MSLSSVSRTRDPTCAISLSPSAVSGANSAIAIATHLLPGDYTSPLLQHMSPFSSMEDAYASPPHQLARSPASPDPMHAENQLVVGMNALRSQDGDCQGAYATSPWSGCLGSQTSSDEFEHYALRSSPAVSSLQQTGSGRSSPRSWDSPEQLGPTPWEAATEQVQGRYHGLDPRLSGYQLRDGAGYNIPTSFPSDASFLQAQGFNGQEECQRARSQTEPYPAGYHTSPRDRYPATPESGHPMSSCSASLRLSVEDGGPGSPGDDVKSQAETLVGPEDPETRTTKKSPGVAHAQTDGPKQETPYAQLIYRAFLSTPRRAMTLQEIYQWFRENTDKGKDDSKGWQNSIRHNLSMNQAFTKRERKLSTGKDGDATSSSSQPDGKKSTEWYLEPWAIAGVQSTTRYRKGNQSRRSAASHGGLSSRVYRSYPAQHHHHHSFSKKGQAHGGRVLRGTRQPLRSTSTPMHHQQQPYPFSPHRSSAFTSHGIHHLINGGAPPSASPSPYAAPPASFFPHQHHSPAATTTTGIEYDYPDPQLFPSSSSSSMVARSTSSEPGAGDDEPVTPEPLHASPYGPADHAIPTSMVDGQGQYYTATGEAHGLPMTGYHQHSHSAYLHHQTAMPPVVGVYDDNMEAVESFQGWGAASVTGLGGFGVHGLPEVNQDGMGVCAEQNGYHGAGY